jgi:DNA-binding CsgD family transcriptional regulator
LLLELLVAIAVSQGDLGAARIPLERLTSVAKATGSRQAAALAALGTGRVRAAGHEDGAAAHLKDALERFSALELPLEAARARLELSRAVAGTSPDVAVSEARLALGAFEQLGAAGDADLAAALLRELGDSGGRSWPRRSGTLTKRELEVLGLLRSGLTNSEIAERLVISRRTAEHHVASILAKLGLRSRAEAAAYAVRELAEDR